MIKKTLLFLALAASFGFGFAFNSIISSTKNVGEDKLTRVTGIGGIFFKCKNPDQMRAWYQKHLGIESSAYGASFEWREADDSTKIGSTQWTPFPSNTKYFAPSKKDFMINYRVADLEALLLELRKEGVTIVDKMEAYDYGKFVHIMDIEGNKIQLWEQID